MQFIKSLLTSAADHSFRLRRPFVTLTYAQSLDGCISARPGESLALSGRQSLTLTHQLRANHDAILVGIGTVLSDNPRLTVRLVHGNSPRPIIVDGRLRLPLDCKLLNRESLSPWIMTLENPPSDRKKALEELGANIITVPSNAKGQVDLPLMLNKLAEMGVNKLMVEGGARIITSFLLERLADYIVLTLAPVLVGGLRAVSDIGSPDAESCLRIQESGHQWLGKDLILWGKLA